METHPPLCVGYDPDTETLDAALNGALRVIQPRQGYRFSVDALLLAAFAPPLPDGEVLDVGTGCGIVALLLAHMNKARRVTAIEAQPELAELADRNVRLNELGSRVRVVQADVRHFATEPEPMRADLVLANPPFFALGRGRENANFQESRARREHHGSLAELVAAMSGLLGRNASLTMVYTVERLTELFAALAAVGLAPLRLRFVHGRAGLSARLVLVEARAGRSVATQVEAPLFLESVDGNPSPEARALYAGDWGWF